MFCLSVDAAGCLPEVEPDGLFEGTTVSFLLLPLVVVGLLFVELCPMVPRGVVELVPLPLLTVLVLLTGVFGALISVSRLGVL